MNNEHISIPKKLQKEADNILSMDISTVKNLQLGYHGETIFLHRSADGNFVLKEYIGGLSGSEYYAKVTANRIKTTIRYGRREEVNRETYVEVFLPESWHGELQISSQYGHIIAEDDWSFDRFATETMEGSVSLSSIHAPRIRISCPVGNIYLEKAEGFVDLHTVAGSIFAGDIAGGAKLETSGGPISAVFTALNNIVECNTLNGPIELTLPADTGINVDGISKTGTITSEITGVTVATKPGNKQVVTGVIGQKPFQNVRISTINGNVWLRQA